MPALDRLAVDTSVTVYSSLPSGPLIVATCVVDALVPVPVSATWPSEQTAGRYALADPLKSAGVGIPSCVTAYAKYRLGPPNVLLNSTSLSVCAAPALVQ